MVGQRERTKDREEWPPRTRSCCWLTTDGKGRHMGKDMTFVVHTAFKRKKTFGEICQI